MKWNEILEAVRNGLNTTVFTIAGTPVSSSTIIVFVILLLVTWIASKVLQRAIKKALDLRGIRDEGTVGVAQRLLHYSVMALGAGVSLQTLGINLSALFAAGAVFAIGLGFAMQNIAQNFVSGIILLLERSIKPGDVLRIEGQLVKVQQLGIRATLVRTLDEEEMIVPNASVVQSTVTNYTLQDSIYRVRCPVGVVYGSDMRRVREVLEQAGRAMDWRNKEREPVVLMTDFGSSSVDFEVSVWMNDPWNVRRAKSQLNEAIWWALKDAGITIAFPQLDVHFDPPVADSLRALGKPA